ncbi:MAG: peptidoglycan-associated lipoprotein Pal [Betaproteobacteria bacterium]|jgi:peptidoglycan-associated lipoprotein|nr:MAG: peptidoglycan-associated lipoprotein Pal [Betaproteobacteria bacterium]
MNKVIFASSIAFLIAGCAGQGQQVAEVEQRDIFEESQSQAELERAEAQKQAQIQREQEELRRQLEEQQRRQEMAERPAGIDEPVIRPLPDESLGGSQTQQDDPWLQFSEPGSLLAERSIYYDFDRYDIKEEFVPIIEAHANFLLANPELRIKVEGNCDDRGSREYNLALGQRRAESVKRAMTLLGVEEDRIETVSFGAERPVAFGQDEASWSQNRRSDIVYFDQP